MKGEEESTGTEVGVLVVTETRSLLIVSIFSVKLKRTHPTPEREGVEGHVK